jgi:hypothetical protein
LIHTLAEKERVLQEYCPAGEILSGDFSDNSIFVFANIVVGNCKEMVQK